MFFNFNFFIYEDFIFKNLFKKTSVSSPKVGGDFLYLIFETENLIGLAIRSIFFF
tara:strand:+ start:569 stop:733 length:165 start_codon:yes stop_codon:yes gene_type:complete